MAKIIIKIFLISCILFFSNTQVFQIRGENLEKIFISELMADPTGSDTLYEWIEIFNAGTVSINLNKFSLNNNLLPEYILQPISYVVIARNKTALQEIFPSTTNIVESSLSLSNSGGEIKLESLDFVDVITYPKATENKSFERRGEFCTGVELNVDGNTIGNKNSNFKTECWNLPDSYPTISIPVSAPISSPISLAVGTPFITASTKIIISEIYPSPNSALGEFEWIEIFNADNEEIFLKGYYISDKSFKDGKNTKKYVLPEKTLEPGEFFIIESPSFSLNNTGDEVWLYNNYGAIIDGAIYNSTPKSISQIRPEVNTGLPIQFKESEFVTMGEANVYKIDNNTKIEDPAAVNEEKVVKITNEVNVLGSSNKILHLEIFGSKNISVPVNNTINYIIIICAISYIIILFGVRHKVWKYLNLNNKTENESYF